MSSALPLSNKLFALNLFASSISEGPGAVITLYSDPNLLVINSINMF